MSKLVLFIDQDRLFADGGVETFPCDLRDELSFSNRIGEQVLIANVGQRFAQGFVALGKLEGFATEQGDTVAAIAAVRTFPDVIASRNGEPSRPGIFDVSDDVFAGVIDQALTGARAEEAGVPFIGASVEDRLSAELARAYNNRCGFSSLESAAGAAFIIQPLEHGGHFHISNYLFLDPEPGELFTKFAWTVGPQLQIIIDAGAVTPDISDTVNRTGRLLLPARPDAEPDRSALAWHFEQFTARISKSRRDSER